MLEGKRAFITGAASGIGKGMAEYFAARGAKVALVDIDVEGAQAAAATIGGAAIALHCDVANSASVQAAIQNSALAFGGLDIIVNNAGVDSPARFLDTEVDDFDRVIAINLRGVFLGSKYGALELSQSGGGSIINISSIAGLGGTPLQVAYAAAKAGVINMTQTTALELRSLGIRVNAICPGIIDTPIQAQSAAAFFESQGTTFEKAAALQQGRVGRTEDIAALAAFLAADESSLITGTTTAVDGGSTAKAF